MATNSYAAKDGKLFMEVRRLMDGRPDAYQNVYELSKNYIYKIINDIVQNHHTTEDLMQETYLQIYKKINTLNEPTAFYVWAGRIATNLTLRHIQKYRKEVAFAQVAEEEDTGTIFDRVQNDHEEFIPETVLHNTEQQRIIAEILDGLSVEQKISVQYYYFEEMSVNDIAEEMQCSPGTVKSRLNYARKALKEAISKFEITNDVKLYSLASIPVFYFVFRYVAEGLLTTGAILGTGAAATAGGAAGNITGGTVAGSATSTAATVGGTATSNSLVNSGAVIGKATAGASTGGTVVTTGTSAATGASVAAGASAAASTAAAGGGFLATVAGKVVVAVTAICIGAGSSVISHGVANEFMYELDYAHYMNYDTMPEEYFLEKPESVVASTPTSTPKPVSTPEVVMDPYQHVEDFLGVEESDLEGINEDYMYALDTLAQYMLEYQAALEYSMTDEQYAYIEQIMAAYLMEVEAYLVQGVQFTQIGEADISGDFMDDYMDDYIGFLYREADIFQEFAIIYSKEEVKNALANHSAAELEEMLAMGGGAGDLIINEISESTAQRLYDNSQKLFELIDDMNAWANRLMSDPELSGYFQ